MLLIPIDVYRWILYHVSRGGQAAFHDSRAGGLLRPTSHRRGLDRTPRRADEGSRRPDTADDDGFALEGAGAHMHLRLHRGSRPDAADDLAPHGQAQGSRPRRIRETRDLDLLPPPRQIADRNA